MDAFLSELSAGLPDSVQAARVTLRLVIAALLGAAIGMQREYAGKPAGLRTHMLVALGAALFVIASAESGMPSSELSRVVQGLATGVGFLGGGAILKRVPEGEISGLTTAAGIWLTAALGVAAGLGRWGAAVLGVFLTLVILAVIGRVEARRGTRRAPARGPTDGAAAG
jgi:putative Mg2+ transporter-C (MgtC) family protein